MARGEQDYYARRKGANVFIFIAYLLFGAYFINIPIKYFQIPQPISQFDQWIIFAGGILMLLGSVYYFQAKRR